MPKVVKKAKPNNWDYSTWGVASRGYKIVINPRPQDVLNHHSLPIIIDVENYKDGRFAGLGVLIPSTKQVYYFTDIFLAKRINLSQAMLIGHVLRTDMQKLKKWGFGIDENWAHYDTALIEHLQDSTKKKYGLKELVKAKFGIEYPKYEQIVGDGDFDTVPIDVAANYNGMDLIATYELWKSQDHSLIETEIYKRLLWPLGAVLNDMEEQGLHLDLEHLSRFQNHLELNRLWNEGEIKNQLGDINIRSPKQLLEALHAKKIFPKFKGKASTDKRGLISFKDSPIVSQLLRFSELDTLLSSFVTPYLEAKTEVIHPRFSQLATRTGRLGCYAPNLQQVPTHTENGKKLKQAFIARPGYVLAELDYSGIEPRLLAHFSRSKALTALFNDGVNFHDFTASRLNIGRQAAKVLNLSTGYRATKYGLAYQLKCDAVEAEKQLNAWWGLWPDLYLWEELAIAEARKTGWITTLLGRKIYIDNLANNDMKLRQTAERRVIENKAQGSTSDIVGLSMIELSCKGFTIVNQVHDSIILEIKTDELKSKIQEAIDIMENVYILNIPLKVEAKYGSSWGTMEPFNV